MISRLNRNVFSTCVWPSPLEADTDFFWLVTACCLFQSPDGDVSTEDKWDVCLQYCLWIGCDWTASKRPVEPRRPLPHPSSPHRHVPLFPSTSNYFNCVCWNADGRPSNPSGSSFIFCLVVSHLPTGLLILAEISPSACVTSTSHQPSLPPPLALLLVPVVQWAMTD